MIHFTNCMQTNKLFVSRLNVDFVFSFLISRRPKDINVSEKRNRKFLEVPKLRLKYEEKLIKLKTFKSSLIYYMGKYCILIYLNLPVFLYSVHNCFLSNIILKKSILLIMILLNDLKRFN